jgi:hypothetical protein
VNLFALGWSRSGAVDVARARRVLLALVEGLPFLEAERVETWLAPSGAAGVAWVTHSPEQVGGVRYVEIERDRMALFSGRPFRWTADAEADGQGPLDARLYLEPPHRWVDALDGRCVAAAYEDRSRELVLYTDPLGAYPVYAAELDGTRWISNNAELLRMLLGTTEVNAAVLASFLGGGWSLSGDPVWARVRRLPRGSLYTCRADGACERAELLPLERIASMLGAGFDPRESARILVASVGTLADWPGRPSIVQLSGGRDSRLILAASLASGFEFEAITSGSPQSADVRVAKRLCEGAKVPHRRLEYDPDGALFEATRETARILALISSGTVCLADTGGFPLRQRDGPLPLWHSGQGGEIARAYYGTGDGLDRTGLVEKLYRSFTREPASLVRTLYRRLARGGHPAGLLSREGGALVKNHLRGWVDEQLEAGVAARDVPDMFYLLKRMATWAGPGNGWVEYGKGDSIAALWSSRILPHQLGASLEEKTREAFPLRILEVLSPSLARAPFEEEMAEEAAADEPLISVVDEIKHAVLGHRNHEAWHALSRHRVERLLSLDPLTLDELSREYLWKPAVWRLATVFLGTGTDEPMRQ